MWNSRKYVVISQVLMKKVFLSNAQKIQSTLIPQGVFPTVIPGKCPK